jgi:hypothetical protein
VLALTVPTAGELYSSNCLVLDLPDGSRVRVWLKKPDRRGRVRVVIDAPRQVIATRGKLLGAAAEGPGCPR